MAERPHVFCPIGQKTWPRPQERVIRKSATDHIFSYNIFRSIPGVPSECRKNNFCHHRGGIHWFYPDPERHVNRFHNPNVIPDFEKQANIAIRDIKKGEELSIADNTIEDF